MLKIESRQWVAVWLRCPRCGAQTGELMLTPWQYRHRQMRECFSYKHDRCALEVVQRRWYTTFCIEPGVSFTTIAGTVATIGPFKLCDIVQPNIRAFRRWVRQHQSKRDEQRRAYEVEWAARRQTAVLVREAEAVAYQRAHTAELAAEQVARAAWPGEESRSARPTLGNDDFDPFLDIEE